MPRHKCPDCQCSFTTRAAQIEPGISDWLRTVLTPTPASQASTSEIYRAYSDWAYSTGRATMGRPDLKLSQNQLTRHIRAMGYPFNQGGTNINKVVGYRLAS